MRSTNQLIKQLYFFAVFGIIGFFVDAGVLDILVNYFRFNPYSGRIISFSAAATTTWILNRHFTFQRRDKHSIREWGQYVLLMIIGGLINYGIYSVIVWSVSPTRQNLYLAVAIGSVCGMFINFISARSILDNTSKCRGRLRNNV